MLQAYKINNDANQKVGIDLASWSDSDLLGNPAFTFNNVLQTGYADITSVQNIYDLGLATGKDFKFTRDEAKYHVRQLGLDNVTNANDPSLVSQNEDDAYMIVATAVGDWTGKEGQIAIWKTGAWTYLDGSTGAAPLIEHGFNFIPTNDEKYIAASWLIGSVGQQITAFLGDFNNKILVQSEYAETVQEIRQHRYKKAVASIHSKLPHKAEEILNTLGPRTSQYKNEGLDGLFYNKLGLLDGDFVPTGPTNGGIGCWVNGLGFFASNGLIDKDASWTTLDGKTPAQYAAELNGILFVDSL